MRHNGWEQSAIYSVTKKDVTKAWRDNTADTVVEKGPRRVLSAGPAPKIFPGDKDRSAFEGCAV